MVGIVALVACAADAPSGAAVSDAPQTERVAVIGDSLAAEVGPPDGSAWPWLVARDTGVGDESVQTSAALEGAVVGAGGVWVDLGDPLRAREQFVQDDLAHPTEGGQRALARAVERELAAAGITL